MVCNLGTLVVSIYYGPSVKENITSEMKQCFFFYLMTWLRRWSCEQNASSVVFLSRSDKQQTGLPQWRKRNPHSWKRNIGTACLYWNAIDDNWWSVGVWKACAISWGGDFNHYPLLLCSDGQGGTWKGGGGIKKLLRKSWLWWVKLPLESGESTCMFSKNNKIWYSAVPIFPPTSPLAIRNVIIILVRQ